MGHGIWDEDALKPKEKPSYNVVQQTQEKFKALEEWRERYGRHKRCPGYAGDEWDCDDCRVLFPGTPANIKHGADCMERGPCATHGGAFVDFVVDKVLALGPKEEEKPFVPYAAVGLASGRVRKVLSESGANCLCTHGGGEIPILEDMLKRITNPYEAFRILQDVTGETSMVEKIKEWLKELGKYGDQLPQHVPGQEYGGVLAGLWRFIADLEAEAKKE